MINQKPKSTGELAQLLAASRPPQKEWVNGKLIEIKKTAPVTVKAATQPDLSHLPMTERLTIGRKLAKQHKLAADNPAPIAPAPAPVAKPSKLDIKLASLPQPTIQEIVYPNGKKVYGYR